MDASRRLSGHVEMAIPGTSSYRHQMPMSVPSPSAQYLTATHFAPRPIAPPPPQVPAHLQPIPTHVSHPPTQMSPAPPPYPQYQQHQFVPQPIPQAHSFQPPNQLAPAYDQHHRMSHTGAAPSVSPAPRQAMPSIQNTTVVPVATGNQYNIPRAPEVYALPGTIDASIPREVKEQFARDENGRVLFFTAPPLERPHKGVSEQHAGLGHSASHLANIHKLREERRRKRKARDEAAKNTELEQAARKKPAGSRASRAQQGDEDLAFKWICGFSEYMIAGNKALEQQMAGWKETKEQVRKENETRSPLERQVAVLNHLFDVMIRDGKMKPEERRHYEEVFVKHKYQCEVDERDNADFLLGKFHLWNQKYGNKTG